MMLKLHLNDTTHCTTGWSNRKIPVCTIQQVVETSCMNSTRLIYYVTQHPSIHVVYTTYNQLQNWLYHVYAA